MTDRKALMVLLLIMATIATVIGGVAIGILYDTAFAEQRRRLVEIAQSQARLIEAIARFDREYARYPGGADEATLAQIRDAHENIQRQAQTRTGEFALARRTGDRIAFFWRRGPTDLHKPDSVAFDSELAEPMRRALSGLSGTMIGLDYRGVTVLAAYEPVAVVDLGIVVKIDIAEVRAPFVRAGAIVIGIGVVLIGLGTLLFVLVSDPIIRHIREGEIRFRELFDNMTSGGAVFQPVEGGREFVLKDLNRAGQAIEEMSHAEAVGRTLTDIFPRAADFGVLQVMRRVARTGLSERIPVVFYEDERVAGWREGYAYRLPSGDVVMLYEDVSDRIESERALRDSEERFRRIAQSANDAIVSIDIKGRVLSWNAAAERIFGYAASEMMGAELARIIPETFQELHEQGLQRLAGGGEYHVIGKTVELTGRHKDGTDIPVELSLSTWTLGNERYFTGILRDISERKAVEDALLESEARLLTITEIEFVAIMIVDDDHVIRFVNSAAESLFGKPREALIGMPFGFPTVEDDAAEIEVVHPDGTIRYAEMRAARTMWEGREQIVLSLRDVSGRKAAEDELRKLTRAIEQSPTSVVITDVNGRIEYVNPKFSEVTGYTFDEAVGRNPRILKSGDMSPAQYESLWMTIKLGRVWTGELRNKKKSGESFWELASIAPVRNDRGEITHFVAVKEDITERKATEASLRQAQKMEVIGQLTGGIAHDFNNYLAIIVGNLQLLEEGLDDDPEGKELIADALWSAERGAELTRRLLAFARRQSLNPQSTDLKKVTGSITNLLKRTLGERIDFETDIAADVWEAMVDRAQLETALVNLALNSRDAMPDGGRLRIVTKNVVLDRDAIGPESEAAPGEYVMIAVSDTGSGMPKAVLERVFEPFFTTKRFGRGSGLGLSMVYGFVRQTGGHVAIDSEVNRGTTVRLYLPRARGGVPVAVEVEADPAHRALPDEVILVVEDDDRVRRTAINLLQKQGYGVLEANKAAEALRIVDTDRRIDLLFTDVVLPDGMNGTHLAKEVTKRRPEIRVLLTSGYAQSTADQSGLLAGHKLLTKPYRRADLASAIRAVLDQPAA